MSWVVRAVAACLLSLLGLAALQRSVQAQFALPVDAEVEEQGDNELPWRGSNFTFSQSLSANSFDRGAQQSFNPEYAWGFALQLNWYLSDAWKLKLEQELEVELTDSDTTNSRQKWLLSDTSLGIDVRAFKHAFSKDTATAVHGFFDLLAPTSLASQAATMVLGTRLGATGALSFSKVMQGLDLALTASYLQRFLRSNVVEVETAFPCRAGASSREFCAEAGGRTNTRFSFRVGASGQLSLSDQFSVYLSAIHVWRRGAGLDDSPYEIQGSGGLLELPDDGNHWRNYTLLEVGASYAVLPWLGLGLLLNNEFDERSANGKVRSPYWGPETYLGLDLQIALDEAYLAATRR